jgi:hypothetical protein
VNKSAALLVVVGLLQMTGDLTEQHICAPVGKALRGIGAATSASPAPKVFCSVRGYEAYTVRFYLEWDSTEGTVHELELTPEVYARIRGPYNRRNVYGAALAYGPVLPANLRDPVLRYALSGQAPLLREMGIDPAGVGGAVRVRLKPSPGTDLGDLPCVFEAPCP